MMPEKAVKSVAPINSQEASLNRTFPVAYKIELHRLIQIAAYSLAEQDGFRQSPIHYWLIAEQKMELGL
jgi:hypothetical protein